MYQEDGNYPIRIAIIGTAERSTGLYGPILKALPEEVNLVSVWGRSVESARKQIKGVPWYLDIDKLIKTSHKLDCLCRLSCKWQVGKWH
jgi:predicted dehydrogenase